MHTSSSGSRRKAGTSSSTGRSSSTRVTSCWSAAARPSSVSTDGWRPRASSRISAIPTASCSSARCRSSRGGAARRQPGRRDAQRLQRDDQPLLRAVVEVPLEPAPLRITRPDEAVVRSPQLALGTPQLGGVADDRDDLVVVDRHDPRLELALVASDRRQHVAECLQPAALERLVDRRHQRAGDVRREQLVHLPPDDALGWVGEQLGVADEVDDTCRRP